MKKKKPKGRLSKAQIENLERWHTLIEKDPTAAAAHAAWIAEEFVVLRSEALHRLFMLQEAVDRIEKALAKRKRS